MAGTITTSTVSLAASGGVRKTTINWVANSSGAVSENPVDLAPGTILAVEFIPGTEALQPADNYDVTLLDEHGIDLLFSEGANLDEAAAKYAIPLVTTAQVRPWHHGGPVDLVVANAGNAKAGAVVVYAITNVLN